LVYNEQITLNASGLSTAYAIYRANSLFDPRYATGGHQPLYFDNLSAVYGLYRVRQAWITVTVLDAFVNTTESNGTRGRLMIYRDKQADDVAPLMNIIQEERDWNIKWKYYTMNTTGRMTKMKMKCLPHVMCKQAYNATELAADVTANPGSECFFHVGISGLTDSEDPPGVLLNIRIVYVAEFYDRKVDQPEN